MASFTISSSNSGLLPPIKTTAQRVAISSPPTGLVVYDSDIKSLFFYNGSSWNIITNSPSDTLSNTLCSPTAYTTLASNWSSSGTLQAGESTSQFRILTTTNLGYLDYTFPANLTLGTYSILYNVEYESNRGIMDVKIRYNGASSPDTTLRTIDLYSNFAVRGLVVGYQDFFTVTSNSTNVLRFANNGKNASSSGYVTGVVTPFIITRWA